MAQAKTTPFALLMRVAAVSMSSWETPQVSVMVSQEVA